MANIDENRRKIVLREWIDELQASRALIENDSLEKTGLPSVRRAILNGLEEIIAFAESNMPGFDPLAVILSAPTPACEERLEEVAVAAEAKPSDVSHRINYGKIYVHRRKGD